MDRKRYLRKLHNPSSIYINDVNKWIWIRVHKTAGTSMYDPFLKYHCINKSKQKDEVIKWINSDHDLENYFFWAFVRNPYDRFISCAAMFDLDPSILARKFGKLRKYKNIIKRHSEPQHLFTHYNGIQMITFLGRYESLIRDWDYVLRRCHLPDFELPRLNGSKRKGIALDQYTQDFVKDYYKLDFEYYGY